MFPARITTHAPSGDLRWLVDHYQWVKIDLPLPASFEERVIPTPRYSFVFQFADAYEGRHAGRPEYRRYPDALIATPVEYPVIVRPAGRTEALRIAMRPHTVELLLRTAATNVRNFVPGFDDVFGAEGRELQARMQEARDPMQCIAIFENWLRRRAGDERARRIPEMTYAIERLAHSNGVMKVRALADELCISERQLERWFLRSVGLRPKFFQRVVRVNAVLDHVRRQTTADWASIAPQFGYSDQSHLVREFVALAGETPGAYLRNVCVMREVFQQSLSTHVLGNDELRASLPDALVAQLAAQQLSSRLRATA